MSVAAIETEATSVADESAWLTTRIGQLKLEVPRDRDGTFRTELFERYQRSEKALVTALMQMVIQGVSTRRVKKIITELCGREFSRQTVSNLTEKLDEQVQAWAERPLGKYPFLLVDAMQLKVRRQGAVRSTTAMIVVGISEEGYREILGFKIALSETGESWKELFEDLKKRGLRGVEFAVSVADESACHMRAWRRLCELASQAASGIGAGNLRFLGHFQRNVLDKTPADCHDQMKDLLDRVLEASSQQEALERFEEGADELREEAPDAVETFQDGLFDVTAVLALPEKYHRWLRTTNMLERLIQEIRRREKVIRILPRKDSAWRLVGALLAEKHEDGNLGLPRSTSRRYLKTDEFYDWLDEQADTEATDFQSEPTNRSLQPA
ncbi:transposase [Salinibacter sp. 10B]|uniref:IS256 family transposase n=1 Tax=Salinibacter sp. 10B TaxID=1923971 RepID=UPI002157545D|nr:transposase [Salinibacter sp. 10B]